MLEVGGEDGTASLGEFGELLRIAVGLAGGGALEQFGVFGGAQGGDFAGEVLQVFQSLALLLVFAGGLGEVEDQAVEQQVAALRALFGFGAGQSCANPPPPATAWKSVARPTTAACNCAPSPSTPTATASATATSKPSGAANSNASRPCSPPRAANSAWNARWGWGKWR